MADKFDDKRIAESREICEEATEAPWEATYFPAGNSVVASVRWTAFLESKKGIVTETERAASATFMAHARTAFPDALDALEAAMGEVVVLERARVVLGKIEKMLREKPHSHVASKMAMDLADEFLTFHGEAEAVTSRNEPEES